VTAEQRARVLALLDEGRSRDEIAREVGVSATQISAILAHRTMGTYGSPGRAALVDVPSKSASPESAIHISLGTDVSTSEEVFWELSNAPNPHVLIVGESGFGKTYAIQCILSEVARQHIGAVIFDFAHGFSESMVSGARILDIGREGLALNPLAIHKSDLHGPVSAAQRVADAFARVYPRLGIQQQAVLRSAILDAFADTGISGDPSTWTKAPPTLSALEEKLKQYTGKGDAITRRTAAAVSLHISTLFIFNIFRETGTRVDWSTLLHHATTILRFPGLDSVVSTLVTEFLLWSLIQYAESLGPHSLRGLLILDEAHRLPTTDGSPIERLLREARKFGIGLVVASQQPEDFTSTIIANTATKLVFQVTDQHARFARLLGRKAGNFSWPQVADLITRLPRGHAYFLAGNTARVVAITPLEQRSSAPRPRRDGRATKQTTGR